MDLGFTEGLIKKERKGITDEGVEGPEVIAADLDARLVDDLRRLELAAVGDLLPGVVDSERDSPDEGLEDVADHPAHHQRVSSSAHAYVQCVVARSLAVPDAVRSVIAVVWRN